MDRRKFIKTGAAAVAAAGLSDLPLAAAGKKSQPKYKDVYGPPLKGPFSSEQGEAGPDDLEILFLGTGAADWNGPDARGEQRRFSSILVDGRVLVDFRDCSKDILSASGKSPHTIFYTHSHGDHYDAAEALALGIDTVYLDESWRERAVKDFKAASASSGLPMPKITGLMLGESVTLDGITFTSLPGNHATSDIDEQAVIYLIEKGDVRVLYATDTAGIPVLAARRIGLDAHIKGGRPITGLIMEATMGLDCEEDFRIFTHSSVGTVLRTADVLQSTGRLAAPAGQPVYLTHMARTLFGTQKESDAELPAPLRAAYDGLKVIFRSPR